MNACIKEELFAEVEDNNYRLEERTLANGMLRSN